MRRIVMIAAAIAVAIPLFAGERIARADIDEVMARVKDAFTRLSEGPVSDIEDFDDVDESYSFQKTLHSLRAVRIESWKAEPEWGPPGRATVHLTLHAAGTGWDGTPFPVPVHWTIEIKKVEKRAAIATLSTDEGIAAYEMLAPQSDEQRNCILERNPNLDRGKVIELLADDLTAAGKAKIYEDAFVFVHQWVRQHDDVKVEIAVDRLASTRAVMRADCQLGIALAEDAASLAERRGDADDWTSCEFSGGIARWLTGSPALIEEGMTYLRKAAARFPDLHDPTTALQSEYMYSYVASTRGNFREALGTAETLRKHSQAIGWRRGVLLADWIVADAESALHNNGIARDYHRRILEESLRNGEWHEANLALSDVAQDEEAMGNVAAARALLERELRRGKRDFASVFVAAELSHLLVQLGEYDEAKKVLDHSDTIGVPDEASRGSVALARSDLAFAQKRYKEAEAFAREAISRALYRHIDIYPSLWPERTALARALAAQGRFDDAELAYRDAIDSVEGQLGSVATDDFSRIHFYEDKVAPYRGLAELLAARGRAAEALATAETIRARALREIVEQGKIDVDAGLTPEERERKATLERHVTEATRASIGAAAGTAERRTLDEARLALEDFDAVVATRHGRAYRGTTARREDLASRDHLAPDEIAVEYLVGERQTLAFLVTRRSVRIRTLPIGARRLHRIVQRLAKAVQQRDLRWETASRAVYDAVLGPLAPDLAPFKHVCVIPDDDLWSVPFDVLNDPRGVALIEKVTVSYAPSLLMLRDTRRAGRHKAERLLLGMANPAINAGTTSLVRSINRDLPLGALPDAEREVERLRDLYGAAHADVHVGAAARETLFKTEAGRYRILHIATHGMVDDHSPMYSCLVLGPDEHNDGLLEMREIVDLDLQADLAVLSSCDTARGRISRGEGMVGVAWAFLAAGCPTTVVSQWKVDSAATERLMVDFHRNLIRGDFQAKANALRKAKLALMKNPLYRHPFYWAPFIVVGDP